MKKTQKIITLVLALISLLALSTLALAADPPTGSITVENAQIGQTYDLYKIFDAKVDTTTKITNPLTGEETYATSYSTTNVELAELILAHQNDSASGTAPICPFKVVGDPIDGVYTIEHRTDVTPAKGRGWLNSSAVQSTWKKSTYKEDSKECTTGNTVAWPSLAYGYYILQPGTGTAVSVDTVDSNITIKDKNPTSPGSPTKEEDKQVVAVGDVVNYTITTKTTNFVTESNGVSATAKQVKYYKFVDEYSDGLTFDATTGIDSITLYGMDEEGEIDTTTSLATIGSTAYTLTPGTGTFTLNIPWVDNSDPAKSLYPSPCYVVIKYHMTVDKDILDSTTLTATNEVSETYKVAEETDDRTTTDPPPVKVYTTALSIAKRDASNTDKELANAKFVLYKMDGLAKKYYKIDTTTGVVTWVDSIDDATEKIADNNYNTKEFMGLTEGTYYLFETAAPSGYNPTGVADEYKIEFDETADPGPFTMTLVTKSDETNTVGPNSNGYFTTYIYNGVGVQMPSTGGTGTTLLILGGTTLFIGTALILITKKRMYNKG